MNPVLSLPRAYFFQSDLVGRAQVNRKGGLIWFSGETARVPHCFSKQREDGIIILHKECTVRKKKRSCSWRTKTNLNFQHLNQTYWISLHEVLQSWWINTVYYLLIWLSRLRGKGRRVWLKEGGSSPYDGGVSIGLTIISTKMFKLIWYYFHLVLESYGKTLVTSWRE